MQVSLSSVSMVTCPRLDSVGRAHVLEPGGTLIVGPRLWVCEAVSQVLVGNGRELRDKHQRLSVCLVK